MQALYGTRRADRLGVPAQVRIGTSGWEYDHWKGRFYPDDVPRTRWLEFYATNFDTVELNASFYRLPGTITFDRWAARVPARFAFAVKASRYLTHVRRLRDPEEPLERLWSRARRLRTHLGPVLYQLPPRWRPDTQRLSAFLAAAGPRPGQVIEFRDARWYEPPILALLESAGVALCLHDMPGSVPPTTRVGPIVYVRFHGSGQKYGGAYPPQHLAAWAERMAEWASEGWPVWAYFNNDVGGHAVVDAARLRDYVERRLA